MKSNRYSLLFVKPSVTDTELYNVLNDLYNKGIIAYSIFQREKELSGIEHIHLYIRFTKRYSFKQVRKFITFDCDLGITRKSEFFEIMFCSKKEGRISGPYSLGL